MASQMAGLLPQAGAAALPVCRTPLRRQARAPVAQTSGAQRRSQASRCSRIRVSAADVDVAATVDAPEAVPTSDTPPATATSSTAPNGQRGGRGGRGGGRGGRGGRGPRPEPTVKPEEVVVDAEFQGVVKSVQTYGAFVDFGAAQHGLVHISQISDSFTDNVSDAVKPGEKVSVRVLSVTDGKVALSMKSKQAVEAASAGAASGAEGVDPEGAGGRARRQGKVATSAGGSRGGRGGGRGGGRSGGGRGSRPEPKVKVGDSVKAKVQRTTPYGAFLDLEDGSSALLHVSQMSNPEGLIDPQPRALLSEGQELEVRVIEVKGGKIDVTQLSREEEAAEEEAKGGVGTVSQTDAGNLFQFALARAGVKSAAFETDLERAQREEAAAKEAAAKEAQDDKSAAAAAPAAAEPEAAAKDAKDDKPAAAAAPAAAEPEAAPAAEPEPEPTPEPEPSAPAEGASGEQPEADSLPQPEAVAESVTDAAGSIVDSVTEAASDAAEAVSEAIKDPVHAAEAAVATAGEAVADAAPEPIASVASAAADTARADDEQKEQKDQKEQEEPPAGGDGASEQQLAAEGEGGDVQEDGVKADEVDGGKAAEADAQQEEPPASGAGASEQQLAAEGEGGDVQADGVKADEADASAAAEQPAPEDVSAGGSGAAEAQLAAAGEGGDVQADGVQEAEAHAADGAAASQLDAAGEDHVQADGVKESEVAAAAEPAKAEAKAGGISAKLVKELREKSGAGMMDCKKALTEASGNFDKALEALRVKGLASAGKKAGRIATEGLIAQYIHAGSRLGVLVEVNCETDFVARGDQFKELVSNLAMQIAASTDVTVVSVDDVDKDMLERERQIELQKPDLQSKPENIREKIVEGRLAKLAKEQALLEAPFVKDTSKTVGEVVKESIAQLGENISVRRFERFVLGEGIEKREADLAAEVEEQTKAFEKKAAEKAAAAPADESPAAEVAAEAAPAVKVSAKVVKELREKSGAGMMDCKKALAETNGDVKAASELLRIKGLASAGKKAGRTASDGAIGAYIHHGSRLGVLVEVNCETDFVARGDTFRQLVNDLAMQIAASTEVTVVSVEDVDKDMLERERQIELQKPDLQSKPDNIREKMVEGRLAKLAKEQALLEQPFIKDNSRTVGDVIKSAIATIGENIQVRRFSRYNLGEGLEKKSNDFAAEVAQQTGRA